MTIYRFLSRRLFPRSYAGKFLTICFAGTHAPLVAFAIYAAAVLPFDRPLAELSSLILIATLGGTAMTLLLVRGLLAPMYTAQRALTAYIGVGARPCLPIDGKDEAGLLLAQIQFVICHLDDAFVEAERQAMTDHLTGAGNRRWLSKEAERVFARRRRTGAPLAAIIADIDYFKSVNDRFGHMAGDEVLRQFACAIRSQLRPDDLFARTGGEEFCILLPDTDVSAARDVAERLRTSVALLRCGDNDEQAITASFGVAAASTAQASLARLFTAADRQLYAAKKAGRDRVCAEAEIDADDIRTAAA